MIIVSDTSAISNLLQINQLTLLQRLYGEVFLTSSVQRELYAIPKQQEYLADVSWLITVSPINQGLVSQLIRERNLDLGEAESIVLAIEKSADYLIIDEKLGRIVAREYDVNVIGVLGVLIKAKAEGVIPNVKTYLEQLLAIGFYLNPKLVDQVLDQLGE